MKIAQKMNFCNNSRISGHNRSIFKNTLDIYNSNTIQDRNCENLDFKGDLTSLTISDYFDRNEVPHLGFFPETRSVTVPRFGFFPGFTDKC